MNARLTKKILMAGASPVLMLMMTGGAFAQSTGTQALEDIEAVTVTGQAQGITGIMKPITVAKERSTITQDFINTQPAGQSIFEDLNKVPGFNFTNNDPYGNSGGDVRIHGFDGNHISFTWDGMPLNDTGNYATYTNQVADAEVIGSASVNQGTTDVTAPPPRPPAAWSPSSPPSRWTPGARRAIPALAPTTISANSCAWTPASSAPGAPPPSSPAPTRSMTSSRARAICRRSSST
jgi:hypothetical protein